MLDRLIVGLLLEPVRYFVGEDPKRMIYFTVAIIAIALFISSS
jgi:hypothetical protein